MFLHSSSNCLISFVHNHDIFGSSVQCPAMGADHPLLPECHDNQQRLEDAEFCRAPWKDWVDCKRRTANRREFQSVMVWGTNEYLKTSVWTGNDYHIITISVHQKSNLFSAGRQMHTKGGTVILHCSNMQRWMRVTIVKSWARLKSLIHISSLVAHHWCRYIINCTSDTMILSTSKSLGVHQHFLTPSLLV